MEKKRGAADEIAEERDPAARRDAGAPDPKKTKSAATIDGASGDICDDVVRNIFARLPARTAVACTALSTHHRRLIRSPEFRSLHLRLAPPLPRRHIAYVATAPIRRRPEHDPVSTFHGFHVAGITGNKEPPKAPMRMLAGVKYLGTSYANTCNGIVLISGEEFSAPARCVLWNPAVADDVKEVSWHRQVRRQISLLIYELGDAKYPKKLPAVLKAELKVKINLKSLKTFYMDGKIYLLRFDKPVILAIDVDEESVSTIDLPGPPDERLWWHERVQLLELSGRPCVALKDDCRTTLWLLTVDHQWETRCVIAKESSAYYCDDYLYDCPVAGVWDCDDVLVLLLLDDMLYKLCLYHVPTEKIFKADLPADLTPKWSDYKVCWGYRPTLVSPASIVDKLNQQGKETRQGHSLELRQLLKPVKEQEMRKGKKVTLNVVCFMEFLSYIIGKLPDDMQDIVETPLMDDSEYSIIFSEYTSVVDDDDGDGSSAEANYDDCDSHSADSSDESQ
ncbi:hypothetical protein HU200_063285 [Digitaria exilis]|uniref:F-box associated domain-containing protein n=1 Tax=Digitaria exilis TaxID=1010633 RepID=A0A835DWK3_9POAL|nr:hypothetical protein HU200_063285 [Digitaria exilis]